jgi:uncharacterized phiE125 gp8 family phage protein
MGLQIITPAVTLPISVDQAKAQSRITAVDAAQDELISLNIQTAVKYAERRLSRQLMTATYKYVTDHFPSGFDGHYNPRALELPVAPIQSITSVQYVGDDGTLQTWDSAEWTSDLISEPARIRPIYQGSWPIYQQTLNAVQVTFVAGYGSASAVPPELKTAILMLAAHLYETREAVTDVELLEVPYAVGAQLDLYRWHPNSFAVI